jgi:outer membrane protein OmpA-like peptidoglycan-associated protein
MRHLLAATAVLLGSVLLAPGPTQAAPDCRAFNPTGGEEQWQVFFATGSSAIDAEGARQVTRAAQRIKGVFATEVCLIGRSSRVGNVAANQRLSQQRVAAVRSALQRQGVAANVLGSSPQGENFQRAYGGQNERDERQVAIMIMRAATSSTGSGSGQR